MLEEHEVQEMLVQVMRKNLPGLYQVIVDLVNQGESPDAIMRHVHQQADKSSLTALSVEAAIAVLQREKQNAIDADPSPSLIERERRAREH